MKQSLLFVSLAAVVVSLSACSSTYGPIDNKTQDATFEKGVPGGTVVETYDLNAIVTAIDPSTRKVTLAAPDGTKTTVKCGPSVINFDQIRVGDVVKAKVTAELTVAMANAATPPTDSGALVALALKNSKPGGVMAITQQYTATITALNLKKHQATLRFPDGTNRTFAVRKDVDLTQRRVGEEVALRVTAAMALSIDKP
jgi:hypothetical protein